jgi:hypothetical protein
MEMEIETGAQAVRLWTANRMREQVARRVAALRDLADEIERHAKFDLEQVEQGALLATGVPRTHSDVVARALHDVMWGMANLSMDSMLTSAQQYDAAVREAVAAE